MTTLNLGTGVTLKGTGAYLAQTGTSTPIVHAYTPATSAGLTDATWTKNTVFSKRPISTRLIGRTLFLIQQRQKRQPNSATVA